MKFPVFQLAGIPVFLALLGATPVLAATSDVTIKMRPHCQTETACREFALYDNETMITNGLEAGDTLDLDIVLANPSGQPVQSVQSWLRYDSSVIQGADVRIGDSFPLVAPGEQAVLDSEGIVRLGASNVSGGMTAAEIVFARVQFRVLSPKEEPAFIRFHEFSLIGQEGKTKALIVEGGRTVNVLKVRPKDLRLHFGSDPPPSVLPSPAPPAPRSPAKPGEVGSPDSGFSRLQPTGLRATTTEDAVFLIWDSLPDQRVRGYNVYYGTVSGRYIQRRTVGALDRGVAIRGLPLGTRYHFAVTAFDAAESETDFSHEVAVVVGDPSSSTAPFTGGYQPLLSADVTARGTMDRPISVPAGRVPGRTGPPVSLLIAMVLVAAGFSVFSFRFFRRTRS